MQSLEITPVLATQVLEIAHAAGVAILDIYEDMRSSAGGTFTGGVSHKSDGSPLTDADLQAHRIIAQELNALTPHVPVVCEEDASSWPYRKPQGEFWLVDPLDGTKEFLARNGEFTVNIALIREGQAVLGIVVAPALAQAYWGGLGIGALREMGCQVECIHVAPRAHARQPMRVIASKSHMNEETQAFIRQLGECELVQAGSSLKFCRVAEGAADIYPRLGPTCEWDTAAAQAIVEAAGGQVTQLNGAPLRYGKPQVLNPSFVASAGMPLPTFPTVSPLP